MLFPTVEFGIFFLLVFAVSWASRSLPSIRKWFLIAASYYFYAFWDWRFAFLLFIISATTWFFGRQLKFETGEKNRRSVLIVAVMIDLLVLGFFKYYGFFSTSFNNLLLSFGLNSYFNVLDIILPVGISFFTFQAISYVVDVYRNEITPSDEIVDVLLYVSFFPQLVAGPIVRASDFIPQLSKKPELTPENISRAFILIIIGLFKKVFFANYLASLLIDKVFEDPTAYSSLENLFAVYGYAFQIYFDFSAYSDIAIGVALLLGYHFKDNFNQPYRAYTIRDFWRRWHISLSTWLRDYVYIPLGGSKAGKWKTYRNLAITMLLGGLWHGAAWNFILWGALHGFALMTERAFYNKFNIRISSPVLKVILTLFVFHFVCFTWIFFRSVDFDSAILMINNIAALTAASNLITPFVLLLLFSGLLFTYFPKSLIRRIEIESARIHPVAAGVLVGIFLVLLGALSPEGVSPFIYFQF
ncbi:MAG: alginate O-acetyltransferase [Melioribacteraceae bacterium]|nr:MAG: alginate O-acetyltransferase [Melioribacteraceae bacterium]